MTPREAIEQIVSELPEHRLSELLDFARFLSWQEERDQWQEFGRAQLAKAYGPEEPDYGIDEVKPELDS